MKKTKIYAMIVVLFIVSMYLVSADGNSSQAQQLISQKIPCSQLNQTQLEMIGDYYMAQIFSPQAHEYMDSMMGGDNAPMDEQMHLSLAYTYYCDGGYTNTSTNGYSGYGMMGYAGDYPSSYYGPGMMYGYGYYQNSLLYYLPWILLALVIASATAIIIVLLKRKKR